MEKEKERNTHGKKDRKFRKRVRKMKKSEKEEGENETELCVGFGQRRPWLLSCS